MSFPEPRDKNGSELELCDYEASEVTGVQIGSQGHKLWVCIDGIAVLRVKSPVIDLSDARVDEENDLFVRVLKRHHEQQHARYEIVGEPKPPSFENCRKGFCGEYHELHNSGLEATLEEPQLQQTKVSDQSDRSIDECISPDRP